MSFPSTAEFIKLNTKKQNELLNVMMLSGADETVDENLVSWKITSVQPSQISVELEFKSPVQVSQGD